MRAPDPAATSQLRPRLAIGMVIALGVVLVASFGLLYPIRGFDLPVGPDASVYIWWTRLAGHDGLSAVTRPGVPALVLAISGALQIPINLVFAGLGATMGAAIGAASAALTARGSTAERFPRTAFCLVGVISGTFAAHLAGGYFANVAWAACVLGGAVSLAAGTRAGAWIAAAMYGAAGLAHPLFWPVGIALLLLATPWRGSSDPALDSESERGRMLLAVGGAAGVFALGIASTLMGPRPLTIPTSKDAYLRRAGLDEALRAAYRTRFLLHWTRYILPLSVPLAWFGVRGEARRSFLYRFLRAWAIIVVLGVMGGMLTAWWPPERLLTSAFVLPIGAALGSILLGSWIAGRNRALGVVAAVICATAFIAAAGFTWSQQHPFFEAPTGLLDAAVDTASVPSDSAIVISTDGPGDVVAFEAARLDNVVRSVMPSERIRNLRVVIGEHQVLMREGVPTETAPTEDPTRDSVAQITLDELAPFDPAGATILEPRLASGTGLDSLGRFSPWAPLFLGIAMLLLFGIVGGGWAMLTMPSDAHRASLAVAIAPAVGVTALMIAGLILDRAGLRLGHLPGGIGSLLLAGVPGYVLWGIRKRGA